MMRISQGDPAGAREDMMVLRRFASLLGREPLLVSQVSSSGLELLSHRIGLAILSSASPDAQECRRLVSDMLATPIRRNFADAAGYSERLTVLDNGTIITGQGLAQLTDEISGARAYYDLFDPASAMESVNAWYDRFTKAWGQRSYPTRTADAYAVLTDLTEQARSAMRSVTTARGAAELLLLPPAARRREVGRLTGTIAAALALPFLEATSRTFTDTEVRGRILLVAAALAAYHAECGRYPDSLAELAPAYLDRVPEDGFIDQPFHYRRTDTGFKLYSVGRDMVDNGGDPRHDADLVLQVGPSN
jgi:hypothetical protein